MKTEFILPRMNVNDNEVEVVKWLVKDQQLVESGTGIVEVSTSKVAVELEAPQKGYIKINFKVGDLVQVGKSIATFYTDISEMQNSDGAAVTPKESAPLQGSKGAFASTRLSKKASEFLQNNKTDPAKFEGQGLVSMRSLVKPDMPEMVESPRTEARVETKAAAPVMPAYDLRFEKVTRSQKIEIAALTAGQSGNINSSVTVQFSSDKIRSALRSLNALNGQLLPLILFELAKLIEKNPKFISFFAGDNIYFYDHINIGVAIDLGMGLKVGVIKDANKLMPKDIYKKLTEYSMKYMKNKLEVQDVIDGTVTVTDLSGDDVLYFQPLVNQNQSAIFGFGSDSKVGGYPVSLTCVFDHRILSGREVSNFLNELKQKLLSYESSNFTSLS